MPKLFAIFFLSTIFSLPFAHALNGTATCHYELYTPEHFPTPLVKQPFTLDLSKTEFFSIEDAALKRVIRLQTQPTTIDGKAHTHIAFSQTYDGAHSGAIMPATNGTYVMMISKDESDLVGAYLFCDVKIQPLTSNQIKDSEHVNANFQIPTFEKVRCVNSNQDHKLNEIRFVYDRNRRYNAEIFKTDKTGRQSIESLGQSELYMFQENQVTLAGTGAVVEFHLPDESGRAQRARVQINQPYYESRFWLCKATLKN